MCILGTRTPLPDSWLHPCIIATMTVNALLMHVPCSLHLTAVFSVSLELQRDCSDQLTLICRHDAVLTDPTWIHNGTVEDGELLASAFPGLTMYSFQNSTEHRVTVTEVRALDGYVFQCAYSIQGTPIKSNTVKFAFVPNGQSHTTRYPKCLRFIASTNCMFTVCHAQYCAVLLESLSWTNTEP